MKELRLPLDFSSTLLRLLTCIILSLTYFISKKRVDAIAITC
jgi:hypothetical protein